MLTKAVGFAFLSPDAIRVILMQRSQYRVHIFTDAVPKMVPDTLNIVIVPNLDKRHELNNIVGIHRVLLHAKGRHQELVRLGIPILDAQTDPAGNLVDGKLVMAETRTSDQYWKSIEQRAVDLDLTVVGKTTTVVPREKVAPTTLDGYFDLLDAETFTGHFSHDIEHPVGQFIVGEINQREFKSAMKALVEKGMDKTLVKAFYLWVLHYQPIVQDAVLKLVTPGKQMSAAKVAKHFGVSAVDLEVLATIYHELGTTQ